MALKWTFAPTEGGVEEGFHNAGLETFRGDLERFIAREAIQNSIDAQARQDYPVEVSFERLNIATKDLPDAKKLLATFKACSEYWASDKKAAAFFDHAAALAAGKSVPALKISDYKTTGVLGDDYDRKLGWYNLVRCTGSSAKESGAGGSFGIGKNAPFAASRMRTVLYSTLNKDKTHLFQGVARLVTHEAGGKKRQATGFLGADDGASAIVKSDIPAKFVRSKPGTDVMVLGYEANDHWEDELVRSVLNNFWPAIHWGKLIVTVGGTKIDGKNLPKLLTAHSDADDFDAPVYHKAYTSSEAQEIIDKLPHLREVSLHLLTGEGELPKHVAMIRKTGMVIYHQRFNSVLPYAGVFVCANDKGNKILRGMEPPRHDNWDPHHPEKNQNKKHRDEYTFWIREQIKGMSPTDDAKVIAIPDLGQYLPDDEDVHEDSFDGPEEQDGGQEEGADKRPAQKPITPRPLVRIKPTVATQGGGGGTGGGGGGGGGDDDDNDDPGNRKPKPAIPIEQRVYSGDAEGGVYTVVVRNEGKSANAVLRLMAVGDQGFDIADIESASVEGGKKLKIPAVGAFGPLKLPGGSTVRLTVKLKDPRRLAMEVEAHEAD